MKKENPLISLAEFRQLTMTLCIEAKNILTHPATKLQTVNQHGDLQISTDLELHTFLSSSLLDSGLVSQIFSEESAKVIESSTVWNGYTILLDPLDGSTAFHEGFSCGIIMGIMPYPFNHSSQPIAACYCMYSGTVSFVWADSTGTTLYHLEQGKFKTKSVHLQIPDGNIVRPAGIVSDYLPSDLSFVRRLLSAGYRLSYAPSAVENIHHLLLHGGVYFSPRTRTRKHGKLRLFPEVIPLAYIVRQSGGLTNSVSLFGNFHDMRHPFIAGDKATIALHKAIIKGDLQ